MTLSSSEDWLHYLCEGVGLTLVIVLGVSANLFSLLIIRNRELNLINDFSRLLQNQAAYDVCYLVMNMPMFVIPALTNRDTQDLILPILPYTLAVLQICLTGDIAYFFIHTYISLHILGRLYYAIFIKSIACSLFHGAA